MSQTERTELGHRAPCGETAQPELPGLSCGGCGCVDNGCFALALPERCLSAAGAQGGRRSSGRVGTLAKNLGAYYTDRGVADLLVAWAVRQATDRILDPSAGDGVFLAAAAQALRQTLGDTPCRVVGLDLDPGACEAARDRLAVAGAGGSAEVECRDFFDLPSDWRQFDAVVGNPPFIRFHRFSGEARRQGLMRASEQEVKLSGLSSSWAPFVVHSASMLAPGGRLAMVVPFEITYALYARPLLAFLARSFGNVTFLSFRDKLFPHLSESTVLLLADKKGERCTRFGWREFGSIAEVGVEDLVAGRESSGLLSVVESSTVCSGAEKLSFSFLPSEQRDLYRELKEHPKVRALGALASVGIGYVTGANSFFHLSPETVAAWRLPPAVLRPAAVRGGALKGVFFTQADWENGLLAEDTALLLSLDGAGALSEDVLAYVGHGEECGVSLSYKCRNRHPWYRVPQVTVPSALLTCMSGSTPRMVANQANAVVPNTLLAVTLRAGNGEVATALAASWLSSMSALSAEVEGHALGGGMLKLEPAEARRVLVPAVDDLGNLPQGLATEIDRLCRMGQDDAARALADQAILVGVLGLSSRECRILAKARDALRARRYTVREEVICDSR